MARNKKNQDRDIEKLRAMRHSCEHVLCQSMKELFPGLRRAMGSVTPAGFYFDFDYEGKISEGDFSRIEKRMKEIIKKDLPFVRRKISVPKARLLFEGDRYKQEWLDGIEAREERVVICRAGPEADFDLCSEPHVASTGQIGPFKLLSIAGAYWQGDEKNKMLKRIYGTAFFNQEGLDGYLVLREEAKKRDHRKIGKELDLFCFSDLVGPGLPLYTPKGTILKEELQKHIEMVCRRYGFEKVMTPHLAKMGLYELSGHASKFGEELFLVSSARGHDLVMKPVQCPHQTQIYASRPRSYRDLPIRYMESEKQYRAEKPGEVGGLNRVYAITVEDGHSFCRVDQVRSEVVGMVNIIKDFYEALGLWGHHWVSLSIRDLGHLEKYIGEPEDWDKCERMLEEVAEEMDLAAKRCEGEAAVYGPKLDFMFKDALGNEVQIPTVQVDFATPKRFNLSYVDRGGNEVPPVMVHRAVLGSYERLLALLIEHFAGAFPVWLAPVQVAIIPIAKRHQAYALKVKERLFNQEIRVELDDRFGSMQSKIRQAQLQKVPYMLIVGDKEFEKKQVAVRRRDGEDLGVMATGSFLKKIKREIKDKKIF